MSKNTQALPVKTTKNNQSSYYSDIKNLQGDSAISSTENPAAKISDATQDKLSAPVQRTRKDPVRFGLGQIQNGNNFDADYNGIEPKNSTDDNTFITSNLVSRAKTMLTNPEAESVANATTLIIAIMAIMGSFQRANMNAALDNLLSIVSQIKSRIAEMKNDMKRTFERELLTLGGELALSVITTAVSIVSLAKTNSLKNETNAEQMKLKQVLEYESLQKNLETNKNLTQANVTEIQTKIKDIAPAYTDGKTAVMLTSGEIQADIHALQARIAYHEATYQLVNALANLAKSSPAFASAFVNQAAADAKIKESEADMEKEKLYTMLRISLEYISNFREALYKLLTELEQMLNINAQNSKAISGRMA
jgi:hypothetical protein